MHQGHGQLQQVVRQHVNILVHFILRLLTIRSGRLGAFQFILPIAVQRHGRALREEAHPGPRQWLAPFSCLLHTQPCLARVHVT